MCPFLVKPSLEVRMKAVIALLLLTVLISPAQAADPLAGEAALASRAYDDYEKPVRKCFTPCFGN